MTWMADLYLCNFYVYLWCVCVSPFKVPFNIIPDGTLIIQKPKTEKGKHLHLKIKKKKYPFKFMDLKKDEKSKYTYFERKKQVFHYSY